MLSHRMLVLFAFIAGVVATAWWVGTPPSVATAQAPQTGTGDPGKTPGEPVASKDLSLDQANAVVTAAVKKAHDLGIKQNVAVVDAGGSLKAFARMDGAWLGSIDIAIKKAKTSRFFDMQTGDIGKLSQPGQPLYMIEISNGGLITFPGGVPLKLSDGTIVGAVGVSGSTVDNDHSCAQAGAQVLSGSK
jgi:uncharacterized protein GlcG (DUF336 family)